MVQGWRMEQILLHPFQITGSDVFISDIAGRIHFELVSSRLKVKACQSGSGLRSTRGKLERRRGFRTVLRRFWVLTLKTVCKCRKFTPALPFSACTAQARLPLGRDTSDGSVSMWKTSWINPMTSQGGWPAHKCPRPEKKVKIRNQTAFRETLLSHLKYVKRTFFFKGEG